MDFFTIFRFQLIYCKPFMTKSRYNRLLWPVPRSPLLRDLTVLYTFESACLFAISLVISAWWRRLTYVWVPGLGSVPDVPRAVYVSQATEGNSAGVLKAPPVTSKAPTNLEDLVHDHRITVNLRVTIPLTDCHEVTWNTYIKDQRMYVEIPMGILPQGSKQRWELLFLTP